MTVLVTGGAGYIGSHMVLNLADAGEKVVVLDNLVTGFDWAIDGRAIYEPGNAGDIALVRSLIDKHGITEIVHFAGSIVVPESVVDPLKYYGNNTATSRNLIEAAVAGGVKHFIFSSTAAVYGMTGLAPVVEETPLSPMSPYGRSKLMTEWMLADVAAAHSMTYGVLRYFNVAGADPQKRSGQSTPMATHLIKVACQVALGQREKMDIFGTDYETPDGTCVRDYIHVLDLADAHVRAVDYLLAGGESVQLNLGTGTGTTVKELIGAIEAVSPRPFQVDYTDRREGDSTALVANNDKAREVLGWSPRYDLTDIIRSAWNWHTRSNHHG